MRGVGATLWEGTRKDESVTTRGWRLSRINVEELGWKAGLTGTRSELCNALSPHLYA